MLRGAHVSIFVVFNSKLGFLNSRLRRDFAERVLVMLRCCGDAEVGLYTKKIRSIDPEIIRCIFVFKELYSPRELHRTREPPVALCANIKTQHFQYSRACVSKFSVEKILMPCMIHIITLLARWQFNADFQFPQVNSFS